MSEKREIGKSENGNSNEAVNRVFEEKEVVLQHASDDGKNLQKFVPLKERSFICDLLKLNTEKNDIISEAWKSKYLCRENLRYKEIFQYLVHYGRGHMTEVLFQEIAMEGILENPLNFSLLPKDLRRNEEFVYEVLKKILQEYSYPGGSSPFYSPKHRSLFESAFGKIFDVGMKYLVLNQGLKLSSDLALPLAISSVVTKDKREIRAIGPIYEIIRSVGKGLILNPQFQTRCISLDSRFMILMNNILPEESRVGDDVSQGATELTLKSEWEEGSAGLWSDHQKVLDRLMELNDPKLVQHVGATLRASEKFFFDFLSLHSDSFDAFGSFHLLFKGQLRELSENVTLAFRSEIEKFFHWIDTTDSKDDEPKTDTSDPEKRLQSFIGGMIQKVIHNHVILTKGRNPGPRRKPNPLESLSKIFYSRVYFREKEYKDMFRSFHRVCEKSEILNLDSFATLSKLVYKELLVFYELQAKIVFGEVFENTMVKIFKESRNNSLPLLEMEEEALFPKRISWMSDKILERITSVCSSITNVIEMKTTKLGSSYIGSKYEHYPLVRERSGSGVYEDKCVILIFGPRYFFRGGLYAVYRFSEQKYQLIYFGGLGRSRLERKKITYLGKGIAYDTTSLNSLKLKLRIFEGEFRYHKPSCGILYKNGIKEYDGYIKGSLFKNQRQGRGRLYDTESKRDLYSGYFQEDKYSGKGKLYEYVKEMSENFVCYEGDFFRGKRHGKGREFILKKRGRKKNVRMLIFDGEYKDGKRDGKGCEYVENEKSIIHGTWSKGRRIETTKESKDIFTRMKYEDLEEYLLPSRVIGGGGVGDVYKVDSKLVFGQKTGFIFGGFGVPDNPLFEGLREKVAVKIIRACITGENETAQKTLLRRIEGFMKLFKLLSDEESKHILRIIGIVEGCPKAESLNQGYRLGYITRVCSHSVQDTILKGDLDINEKIRILYETCEGMKVLHSRGIIHRDLKWPNVLVDFSGCVKIMDFDTVREEETQLSVSQTGGLGTFGFMPPEYISRKRYYLESDVYSFGIMMFCLLHNEIVPYKVPYEKCGRNCQARHEDLSRGGNLETHIIHCNYRPGPISEELRKTHPDLVELMEDCWQPERLLRPSFDDISKRLDAIFQEQIDFQKVLLRFEHDGVKDQKMYLSRPFQVQDVFDWVRKKFNPPSSWYDRGSEDDLGVGFTYELESPDIIIEEEEDEGEEEEDDGDEGEGGEEEKKRFISRKKFDPICEVGTLIGDDGSSIDEDKYLQNYLKRNQGSENVILLVKLKNINVEYLLDSTLSTFTSAQYKKLKEENEKLKEKEIEFISRLKKLKEENEKLLKEKEIEFISRLKRLEEDNEIVKEMILEKNREFERYVSKKEEEIEGVRKERGEMIQELMRNLKEEKRKVGSALNKLNDYKTKASNNLLVYFFFALVFLLSFWLRWK